MRVQDVLCMKSKRLITISRRARIQDAARLFTAERVGMLLVVDNRRRLAGLLFECDAISLLTTRGADALALPVWTATSVVRSDVRRGGKEWVSTWTSWWSRYP